MPSFTVTPSSASRWLGESSAQVARASRRPRSSQHVSKGVGCGGVGGGGVGRERGVGCGGGGGEGDGGKGEGVNH